MQIIIPMAGMGSRFIEKGFAVPKTLISIEGKPMIEHVVNLFPAEKNLLFICNTNHVKKFEIDKKLHSIKPSAKIVAIASHKLGPVETILRAYDAILDDVPIIIAYCDFSLYWNYKDFKKIVISENIDGAIVCYKGFHPHLLHGGKYAGVKGDNALNFIETKEKYSYTLNPMDSWQSAGIYYFRSGKLAKKYLSLIRKRNVLTNGEYYVPWAFNFMKEDTLRIKIYPVSFFCQWGTPEDLEEYFYWSKYFFGNNFS